MGIALNGTHTACPPSVQKGQGSHFLKFHCILHPVLGTLQGVTSHPHNILGRRLLVDKNGPFSR